MFFVKRAGCNEHSRTVYGVMDIKGLTHFLFYNNYDGWYWSDASLYIPVIEKDVTLY